MCSKLSSGKWKIGNYVFKRNYHRFNRWFTSSNDDVAKFFHEQHGLQAITIIKIISITSDDQCLQRWTFFSSTCNTVLLASAYHRTIISCCCSSCNDDFRYSSFKRSSKLQMRMKDCLQSTNRLVAKVLYSPQITKVIHPSLYCRQIRFRIP